MPGPPDRHQRRGEAGKHFVPGHPPGLPMTDSCILTSDRTTASYCIEIIDEPAAFRSDTRTEAAVPWNHLLVIRNYALRFGLSFVYETAARRGLPHKAGTLVAAVGGL
jgi:hypothetical protein